MIKNVIQEFIDNSKRESISELVKNEEWQKVRRSMLGKWVAQPQWCCDQLTNYLGSITTTTNDKLRIVMNYATGSVFRTGKVKHPCVADIRRSISDEIKRRKQLKTW